MHDIAAIVIRIVNGVNRFFYELLHQVVISRDTVDQPCFQCLLPEEFPALGHVLVGVGVGHVSCVRNVLDEEFVGCVHLALQLLLAFFTQGFDAVGKRFEPASPDHSNPDTICLELLRPLHVNGEHANGPDIG